MKTRVPILYTVLACAWLTVGSDCATAADKLIDLPPSKITLLDFTNMTFTVELTGTNLTAYMTSETRLFKDGKYAISKDLKEGELVRGKLKKAADDHDRSEAVRIFWGKPSPRER
jgi:hypothetical protein